MTLLISFAIFSINFLNYLTKKEWIAQWKMTFKIVIHIRPHLFPILFTLYIGVAVAMGEFIAPILHVPRRDVC